MRENKFDFFFTNFPPKKLKKRAQMNCAGADIFDLAMRVRSALCGADRTPHHSAGGLEAYIGTGYFRTTIDHYSLYMRLVEY